MARQTGIVSNFGPIRKWNKCLVPGATMQTAGWSNFCRWLQESQAMVERLCLRGIRCRSTVRNYNCCIFNTKILIFRSFAKSA